MPKIGEYFSGITSSKDYSVSRVQLVFQGGRGSSREPGVLSPGLSPRTARLKRHLLPGENYRPQQAPGTARTAKAIKLPAEAGALERHFAEQSRRWMRRSGLPRPWAAPQEGFVATATESGCRAREGAGGSSSSAGRGGWMPSKSGSDWEVSRVPSCPSPRARGRAPVHPQTTAETSLGRVCQR